MARGLISLANAENENAERRDLTGEDRRIARWACAGLSGAAQRLTKFAK